MKLRSFFYLLGTIAASLFLAGAIGFFWLFSQSPLGLLNGSLKAPTTVMFVPKHASVMASLMVNPDRLEALRLAKAQPEERKQARLELARFKQSILGASGLEYQQDIQPWLGDELTLAITTLDIDRDPDNGHQPGYLIAATTKDAQRSREFLQQFWQRRAIAGTDLVFEPYKGTKLIYGSSSKEDEKPGSKQSDKTGLPLTLASAVVGDRFVLFANSPKVLRDAINTVQATELGLSSVQAYQSAIASLKQGRVGVAFLNLPQLSALAGETVSNAESSAYRSLAIALGFNPQGLTAETALLTAARQDPAPASSRPVGALGYIPASSPAAVAGRDLDQLWLNFSQGVSDYRSVTGLVNRPLDALQKSWNLRLPEDIFSWVKGEYALGLLPSPENRDTSSTDPTALSWVFVADKSADPTAEAAIAHLDELAQQQGISVGSLQIEDQRASVWTRLSTSAKAERDRAIAVDAEVAGVHASVGSYEIFATSVEAMGEVLKATKNPLLKSENFAAAIAPFSKRNSGLLYVDWNAMQPILEQQFPLFKVVELAGQPLLGHLRSFSLSSGEQQPDTQRGSVFVKLES